MPLEHEAGWRIDLAVDGTNTILTMDVSSPPLVSDPERPCWYPTAFTYNEAVRVALATAARAFPLHEWVVVGSRLNREGDM